MAHEPRLKRVLFLCSGNYYRSRFAEELFNHLASADGLPYRADSAGLWPECHTHNPGPMSAHTIAALSERGISLPRPLRSPKDVRESDLLLATLTIAVKEAEHRPLLTRFFPRWASRVEYWQIDDVADAPPSAALPLLEREVRALVSTWAVLGG